MKKILIRVDASGAIGYGHLTRCINLARYFSEKGVECLFVTRCTTQQGTNQIRAAGFAVQEIIAEPDILQLKEYSPVVVTDINSSALFADKEMYKQYLSFLQENKYTVIAFEEPVADVYASDVVIIPYVGSENVTYHKKAGTQYLLGPDYFIFRQEFIDSPKAVINEKVNTVFICMGGTDPQMITEKILHFLVNYPGVFHLDIVFADLETGRAGAIKTILASYKGTYTILINPDPISTVMVKAGLAVSNSGLIKYELGMLGLPTLAVSNTGEDEENMKKFALKGSLVHLGRADRLTENDFSSAFSKLVNHKEEREKLSANGTSLFDGRGMERIYNAVIGHMP